MKLNFTGGFLSKSAISLATGAELQNKKTFTSGAAASVVGTPGTSPVADLSSRNTTTTLSQAALDAFQAQAKRLEDMRSALERLRAMPSASISAKQAAAERAAKLKQRLDMLKQMMIGASPAQARAMAAQLKDIAKELASLGKNLGGDGGVATAGPESGEASVENPGVENSAGSLVSTPVDGENEAILLSPTGADADLSVAEVVPTSAGTDVAEATAKGDAASSSNPGRAIAAYTAQRAPANPLPQNAASGTDSEKVANEALKKALGEAQKALRSLIAMVKGVLGRNHKDVKEAEAHLVELELAMNKAEDSGAGNAAIPLQVGQDGFDVAGVTEVTSMDDVGAGISGGSPMGGSTGISV
jgi:hypothetical protein